MIHEMQERYGKLPNQGQIREYLQKILKKEAFDGSGLIYGMGHAVYTLSDPREVALRGLQKGLPKQRKWKKNLQYTRQ